MNVQHQHAGGVQLNGEWKTENVMTQSKIFES